MSVDSLRGWQIVRSAPLDSHDPACSFARTTGDMPCDCSAPEYRSTLVLDEIHSAWVGAHRIDDDGTHRFVITTPGGDGA